ncbi:glycine--tRNA ligase [Candidatus Pacearchaeota archaeon]|nr:glycine--tRNA ligase [Candidatus Pacearchaeota archaeon]
MFVVKKKIAGKEYYYLRESKREGKKVRAKTIAYLGKTRKEAEKRMKEFLKEKENKKIMEKENKEAVKIETKTEQKPEGKKREIWEKKKITIDELAVFCKRKGFVFPSSEIYGGLAGFWDLGPLGVELFNNIKQKWWKFFVQERQDMIGIDASIISHPKTWKASGHVANFSDVSVSCRKCKKFNKVDKSELEKARCSFCSGELDKATAKDLNLMFKTQIGPVEEDSMLSYLRPETAQGMFLDFKNITATSRVKLPFGIAQIGKCFRNEIAPRDFLFRSREFNIAEFEFFIHPEEKKCPLLDNMHLDVEINFLDAEAQKSGSRELRKTTIGRMLKEGRLDEWHAYWLAEQVLWFKEIGISMEKINAREHTKDELSHYSSATFDLDYEFSFGNKEIAGNANRGQYDLAQHAKESSQKLDYFDEESKARIVPRVIEPTFGMERAFLAVLSDAYAYDEKRQNIVLRLNPKIAPVKAAVFPIVKGEEFEKIARDIYNDLKKEFNINYDEAGSVGRRYSRADEAGTPFCITIDGDSIKSRDVTIRNRDDTKQIRVKISELKDVLRKLIAGEIEFEKAGRIVETRVLEGKI